MKKYCAAFIALLLLALIPCTAYASESKGIGSILESDEELVFSNAGTSDPEDIRICIEAYSKKNEGVSTHNLENLQENVHASENIKIYAFTTKKPSVFYDEYNSCNDLNAFVSSNYSIIRVFRDSNNTLIDSVFYMKPENSEQSDGEWKRVSSGGMIFSDETIELLTDKNAMEAVFDSYNINNPENLKVITGVDGLEGLLYFENDGVQIVMPLSDGYKYDSDIDTCEKLTPYVASEFFEARKMSDLENEAKLAEWDSLPMDQKTYGTSTGVNYVDLKSATFDSIIEADIISSDNADRKNVPAIVIISVMICAAIAAIIMCYKNNPKTLSK